MNYACTLLFCKSHSTMLKLRQIRRTILIRNLHPECMCESLITRSSEVPLSSNSIRRSQTAAVCKFPSFFCVPVAIVPDDPAGAEIQGLLFDSRELNPASILVFPAWLPAPIVRIARRQRDVVRCSRLYVGWGTHLSIFRPAGCLPAGVAGPAIGLTLCSRAGLTYPNIIGKDLCSALACARLPTPCSQKMC